MNEELECTKCGTEPKDEGMVLETAAGVRTGKRYYERFLYITLCEFCAHPSSRHCFFCGCSVSGPFYKLVDCEVSRLASGRKLDAILEVVSCEGCAE